MPALAQPTGEEIIATLVPSGGGAMLGTWSADKIDAYITDALVNVVTQGFNYASDLLTDAGYNPATLTQANWDIATMAMLYGIAYELLNLDRNSQTTISEEREGGIRKYAYQSSGFTYSDLAGQEWEKLGITSRYKRNFTAGFGVESTERKILNDTETIE
jgi:hypothetical protein